MSVRTKILGFVDVILRVPPLFLLDEIFKIGLGLPIATDDAYLDVNITRSGLNETDDIPYDTDFYRVLLTTAGKFIVCCLGCIGALCVFTLWTKHLVIVYMYLMSIGLILLSYWSNASIINFICDGPSVVELLLSSQYSVLLESNGPLFLIAGHFIVQLVMGLMFQYVHLGPRYPISQKILPYTFMLPMVLALFPLPKEILRHAPMFATIIPLALVKIALWVSAFEVVETLYSGYQHARNYASNYGLSALVESEWQRLNVPCVLRAFWMIRLLEQLTSILAETNITFMGAIQSLLVCGCETVTAVLGMTSIVSLISHYIGKFFQMFLLTDDDEDKSMATVSAIVFYILALQTGLTSLAPEKRFVRLCRNLCLLMTALLHYIHNNVSPLLMSLSAARNPSRNRHIRALLVCLFLVVAPLVLLAALWSRHPPSTWLLAVTAFSIELIVKVLVSLATYTLFLLDARRTTFWEPLDDYVYYIRGFGNGVEFLFGIFLFFNGAWILIFESGGAIRAVMMCVHAYFNIWCEARAGWGVFMKRRTAVHKIRSLPEATKEDLEQLADVCAICYQEMTAAKITRCRHFFHGVCLRKWLYVQDSCPLCHELLHAEREN